MKSILSFRRKPRITPADADRLATLRMQIANERYQADIQFHWIAGAERLAGVNDPSDPGYPKSIQAVRNNRARALEAIDQIGRQIDRIEGRRV